MMENRMLGRVKLGRDQGRWSSQYLQHTAPLSKSSQPPNILCLGTSQLDQRSSTKHPQREMKKQHHLVKDSMSPLPQFALVTPTPTYSVVLVGSRDGVHESILVFTALVSVVPHKSTPARKHLHCLLRDNWCSRAGQPPSLRGKHQHPSRGTTAVAEPVSLLSSLPGPGKPVLPLLCPVSTYQIDPHSS